MQDFHVSPLLSFVLMSSTVIKSWIHFFFLAFKWTLATCPIGVLYFPSFCSELWLENCDKSYHSYHQSKQTRKTMNYRYIFHHVVLQSQVWNEGDGVREYLIFNENNMHIITHFVTACLLWSWVHCQQLEICTPCRARQWSHSEKTCMGKGMCAVWYNQS